MTGNVTHAKVVRSICFDPVSGSLNFIMAINRNLRLNREYPNCKQEERVLQFK